MDKHYAPFRLAACAAVVVAATSLTACSSSAKSAANPVGSAQAAMNSFHLRTM